MAADRWRECGAAGSERVAKPARQPYLAAVSAAVQPSLARARQVVRGLYAITPDWPQTQKLVAAVDECLGAGARLLQYRNKLASAELKREQLEALVPSA